MDIRIIDQGSIVQFMPLTDDGAAFLQHSLDHEGWQWMGRSLCVDHRFANGVIELAVAEGLEIS